MKLNLNLDDKDLNDIPEVAENVEEHKEKSVEESNNELMQNLDEIVVGSDQKKEEIDFDSLDQKINSLDTPVDDKEIVQLSRNELERLNVAPERKINKKIIIRIAIVALLVLLWINPLNLLEVEKYKQTVKDTFFTTKDYLQEKVFALKLAVTGDNRTIVENEDYKSISFTEDPATGNVVFNVRVDDNTKKYFLIFQTTLQESDSLKEIEGLSVSNITANGDTGYVKINTYDYNPLYNYELIDTSNNCCVVQFDSFKTNDDYSIYINQNYNEFKDKYITSGNYEIVMRKEY